jgi:hypothetical protein
MAFLAYQERCEIKFALAGPLVSADLDVKNYSRMLTKCLRHHTVSMKSDYEYEYKYKFRYRYKYKYEYQERVPTSPRTT